MASLDLSTPTDATLNDAETYFASRGRFPKSFAKDGPAGALFSRYVRPNYRKAEAAARADGRRGLQLLKSLLARGLFDEALDVHRRIAADPPADRQFAQELALQDARHAFYSAEWERTTAICGRLDTEEDLPALSRMCALQLRANAWFEIGEFGKSAADVERVASLESLFPYGSLHWYAHTNALRLELRTGSSASARAKSDFLRRKWRSELSSANADVTLTLVRARIDELRFRGEAHSPLAVAAFVFARRLGDDLYEALAYLDYAISRRPEASRLKADFRLTRYTKRFARVRKLLEEVLGENAGEASETGRGMRAFLAAGREGPENAYLAEVLAEPDRVGKVIFADEAVEIDLARGVSSKCDIQDRSRALLKEIASRPIERGDLFRAVWRMPFEPERRDSLLRVTLHRLRKQSGIAIEHREGEIRISPSHFVLLWSA